MPKSVRGVMDEFKRGQLHSGTPTGPKVKKRKQAVAIALAEQKQPSDVQRGGYNWRDGRHRTRKA